MEEAAQGIEGQRIDVDAILAEISDEVPESGDNPWGTANLPSHRAPLLVVEELEEQLRRMIGTALIQSGYLDQDPNTGEIELLEWHACSACPNTDGCACAGMPYLSSDVWNVMDRFQYLTMFMKRINGVIRQSYVNGWLGAREWLGTHSEDGEDDGTG